VFDSVLCALLTRMIKEQDYADVSRTIVFFAFSPRLNIKDVRRVGSLRIYAKSVNQKERNEEQLRSFKQRIIYSWLFGEGCCGSSRYQRVINRHQS